MTSRGEDIASNGRWSNMLDCKDPKANPVDCGPPLDGFGIALSLAKETRDKE